MKNKDLKKGKESIIGKIIYGFLLFMPLIAIGVTCIITTFNMSAKEESEIIYKYKTNEVNNSNDLVEGNIYRLSFTKQDLNNLQTNTSIIDNTPYFNFIGQYNNSVNDTEYNLFQLRYIYSNGAIYINQANVTGNTLQINSINIPNDIYIDFVYVNNTTILFNNISICNDIPIESVETHNINSQDVFYNSVDKVEQSSLFNWAENSLIYTGISNTCTQLSITTTFIPLLLAYWLIISVIYILYDIILMVLIILHNKIHQLQDSLS